MSETSKKVNTAMFNNPMETFPGLTIDDLNRYLPALQTMQDIKMDSQHMKEGMFLANCLDGLRKLPSNSIDLIIANPLNTEPEEVLNLVMVILFKVIISGTNRGLKNHEEF